VKRPHRGHFAAQKASGASSAKTQQFQIQRESESDISAARWAAEMSLSNSRKFKSILQSCTPEGRATLQNLTLQKSAAGGLLQS
jgi:hypothetical protein